MGLFSKKKQDSKEEKATGKAAGLGNGKSEEKKKSMKELYEEEEVKTISPKEDKKAGKEEIGREIKRKFLGAHKILIKPLVTEKATNLGAFNKYVFAVSPQANKIEIARAIEEIYGIKPVSVNIIKVKGKTIRSGRTFGRRKDWKKAVIALPAGKTIKIYEGV